MAAYFNHTNIPMTDNSDLDVVMDEFVVNDMDVPEHIVYYIYLVNYWGPAFIFSVFGMLTNALNIVTFLKQSLRDTVNVSLLGLAIADFGSLVFVFLLDLCFVPAFIALDLNLSYLDFVYLFGWTHVLFTRVSACITAYITFERCICIAFPLKVKQIITPRVTVVYIITVNILSFASSGPIFYSGQYGPVFDPARNKTVIGVNFMKENNRQDIEAVGFALNNIIPTVTFLSVIVFTVVLVKILKSKSKWRRQTTGGSNSEAVSDRDARVVKMVILISSVFILCYSPGAMFFFWALVDTHFRVDGKHAELLFVSFSFLCHLETINASVNIFIYLRMSSKFKATFLQTFCRCSREQILKSKHKSPGNR